jgi:LuxR family maltose regulon positive regulatory protein
MPKVAAQALIWSAHDTCYGLYIHDQLVQRFRPGDDAAWLAWLADQISVAFHGRSGHLNVHNEARRRGGRYWYAYHATRQGVSKRYLGRTARLTFARLEHVAAQLTPAQAAPRTLESVVAVPPAHSLVVGLSETGTATMSPALLSTKLVSPPVPAALVTRERLLHQLDAALSHRLTVLSAAAGWGKTTLLSAWGAHQRLEARDRRLGEVPPAPSLQPLALRIAWLSLDELDNDATRFWIAVIATLRTCVPDVGALALAMLHSSERAPLFTILSSLLNDLDSRAHHAPILLILDDYHVIDEPAIHEAMTFLLDHLPAHLHLVLATRVDPELALARWRVRGELREIRATDLRFSAAEATAFLMQALGDDLRKMTCGCWKAAPKAGSPACSWRRWLCASMPIARPSSGHSRAAIAISWTTCRRRSSIANRSPSNASCCRLRCCGA